MFPQSSITRRHFLQSTSLAAATLALPAFVKGAPVRTGKILDPEQKLNIACVGCGGKGSGDVRGVAGENIVALCDVDWNRAKKSFENFPKAARFRDYRKMLLEMDDQIDAVTVSTPDHMHFPIAMMAIQMGKHVFVQKPLTHTIWEARELTLAARRHKVMTQMGIQGHTMEGARMVNEWVNAGAIGPVTELHYWTDRPIWPQGIDRPQDAPEIPSALDWNLWLGVAPVRPYHPSYVPFKWRGWWDFGCGALGDIGCHAFDAAFWALDLGAPTSVEAETTSVNDETAPKQSKVVYQFPARGDKPPVKLVWLDGKLQPDRPADLEEGRKLPGGIGGQLWFGEKGTMMASDTYCKSARIIPESKMKEFLPNRPPQTIPRSPGIYAEWINACKGGPKPGANFDYAGPLTEMVLLGNLAVRTGKRIEWDAANMRCTNVPEANQYVRHDYRIF